MAPKIQEIKDNITKFISEEFKIPAKDLDYSASFSEREIVDSLGIITIVSHLQNQYKLYIPAKDYASGKFDSISDLTNYVARKIREIKDYNAPQN